MNEDTNKPEPQPWIDPALEARLVAHVLGETSAFEAAELERLLAENPELALFKRRIEAVHSLAVSAAKPDSTKLQLPADKRQKLLDIIGRAPAAQPSKRIFVMPNTPWWKSEILLRVAVCLVMIALVLGISSTFSLNRPSEADSHFANERGSFSSIDELSVNLPHSTALDDAKAIPQAIPAHGTEYGRLPQAQAAHLESHPNASLVTATSSALQALVPLDLTQEGSETAGASSFKQSADGDSNYMYRGVNVMEASQPSALPAATPAPIQLAAGSTVTSGVTTPAFDDDSRRRRAPAREEDMLLAKGQASGGRQEALLGEAKEETAQSPAPTADAAEPITRGSRSASTAISVNAVDALLFGTAGKDLADAKKDSRYSGELSKSKAAKDLESPKEPAGTIITQNVINQPIFSSRDGKIEFDGFVNYGSPISTETVAAPTEEQKAENGRLVAEADALAASGRYDLAYKRYEQVLSADPYDISSRRGMEQVNQARQKYASAAYDEARDRKLWVADAGWDLPVRKFDIGSTTVISNPEIDRRGATLINRKLDEIIIPRIDFADTTVRDALDFLKQRAFQLDKDQDPSKRGVNIVLNLPEAAPEADARISLGLTDIPLRAAIDYVSKAANLKTKVEPYAVSVVLQSTATDVLITKEIKVPPGFIAALPAPSSTPLPGTGATTAVGSLPAIAARSGAKEYLENSGVTFPPGATAYFIASSSKLIVKNTQANLDLIDTITARTAQVNLKPVAHGNETLAADQPFSTFSLHVSDVSFQLARDALARGAMPDSDRIRTEEFYNAFDYNDPAPAVGEEVTCRIERCGHPYLQQRDLVRLAVKVAAAGRAAGQPLRLTILLDTSGSMEREDRAETVRRALESLVTLLGPQDRVTLIGFARTPRLLAEDVPGDQAGKLVEIAIRTPSEGGTNLEEALALASKMALKSKLANAQNRIVLLTDGAANLGDANPERLARQIEGTRQQSISFDACGVGAKELNDGILEALTRKGDGRYYYLNSPEDADEGFARQLAGAFRPAAENVKVQVVFNPARVSRYRLLGFEKHLLKEQDFRNDKVQAAELSAEEAGVALYQVETLPDGNGEIGEVFVRFRDPARGTMIERSWTMPYEARVPAFDQASASLQLATVSALLAETLRGDQQIDLDVLAPVIPSLRNSYSGQERVAELIQMFEKLRR